MASKTKFHATYAEVADDGTTTPICDVTIHDMRRALRNQGEIIGDIILQCAEQAGPIAEAFKKLDKELT